MNEMGEKGVDGVWLSPVLRVRLFVLFGSVPHISPIFYIP